MALYIDKQGADLTSLPKLTYPEAREISIMKYKLILENDGMLQECDTYLTLQTKKFAVNRITRFRSDCPLCEFFHCTQPSTPRRQTSLNCARCPLYWKHAKKEDNSKYTELSLKCTRNFWKFTWWYKQTTDSDICNRSNTKEKRYMLHWLKKLITELENTPETLG